MKKLIPAGLTPGKIKLIRTFIKDIQGDGYTVIEASFINGDIPIASVKKIKEKPINNFIKGCRLMLSSSEEINEGDTISSEEAETIAAARLTARVALEKLTIDTDNTVGSAAHGQVVEGIMDQEDIHDDIED
jgi:hypothetical protein